MSAVALSWAAGLDKQGGHGSVPFSSGRAYYIEDFKWCLHFQFWGCVLEGYFERGICWRAKSRLKGIDNFNLEHLTAMVDKHGGWVIQFILFDVGMSILFYLFLGCIKSWLGELPHAPIMVWAMKLLRIMLRNRCWPTTFHTITAGDADYSRRYRL
jgi:hypothetical protein